MALWFMAAVASLGTGFVLGLLVALLSADRVTEAVRGRLRDE